MSKKESIYTTKIKIPVYEPTGKNVELKDLLNVDKYVELLKEINIALKQGEISEQEAKFLKLGATRWIQFKYSNIGEYYAKSTPEMQRLIERSCMVILDVDDALANQVVMCRNFIDKIRRENYSNDTIVEPKSAMKDLFNE